MATIDEIRALAIERHQKKMMKDGEAHNHDHSNEGEWSCRNDFFRGSKRIVPSSCEQVNDSFACFFCIY
ncbi:hypothetical protein MKX73_15570 [Solibacillus sp. FSL W7-1436]|uniref:hypothetical protein n=1 Tax=unclassified Solibacillus TaxID=2637870 RepID=UPI0030FA3961